MTSFSLPGRLSPSVMPRNLILYSGTGCHLCDQAREVIHAALAPGWELREVDVRADVLLNERYGLRIPVVAVEDGGEKGWPFSAGQVRRLMAGAGDTSSDTAP